MSAGTVKRSDLAIWKMVSGLEDSITSVIDDGVKKTWVAIGWIDEGTASAEDMATYPTVVEA